MTLSIGKDLYYAIKTLNISPDGTVIRNVLDEDSPYISQYYTPNLSVGSLCSKIKEELDINIVVQDYVTEYPNTIGYFLENSDLEQESLYAYDILKSVVVDCFCIIYALNVDTSYQKYITSVEIDNDLNNIFYIIDYLSGTLRYSDQIDNLYSLVDQLGVIKNQLNFSAVSN